jgi:hypothetical protein
MALPLAIAAAIARAAISSAARRRIMLAAAKKITSKEVRQLIREEQKKARPRTVPKEPRRGMETVQTGSKTVKKAPLSKGLDKTRELVERKPDTSVKKSYQKDRTTPTDVRLQRALERKKRIEEGTSPAKVKPPKKSAVESAITDRQKAMAKAALKRERKATAQKNKAETKAAKKQVTKINVKDKIENISGGSLKLKKPTGKAAEVEKQNLREGMTEATKNERYRQPTIESREPVFNPDRPPLNELSAFTQLSRAQKKAFFEADARVIAGLKKIQQGKNAKPDMPAKSNVKLPSLEVRLQKATEKLTPEQLAKIKRIVADVRRRSGN